MSTPVNRRIFGGALLAGTGALAVQRMRSAGLVPDRRKPRSRVAILNETSYSGPARPCAGRRCRVVRFGSPWKDRSGEAEPGGVHPRCRGEYKSPASWCCRHCVSCARRQKRRRGRRDRDISATLNSCLRRPDWLVELRGAADRFVDFNRDEIVKRPLATALHRARSSMAAARRFWLRTLWCPCPR